MIDNSDRWVIDTTAYTHLCRAGHAYILEQLAPAGSVIVPTYVNWEIEDGRASYVNIPPVSGSPWAELAVLTDDEEGTMLEVKAEMAGDPTQHLGECAVIAVARHRGYTAVLDEREAVNQADFLDVNSIGTVWIVIEAYLTIFERDRAKAEQVIEDLLLTGMWLPIKSGEGLFAWAYEDGLLPRD